MRIREVAAADDQALGALEHASPDSGAWLVRIHVRVGYLELVSRYPGVRGYVAVEAESAGERIVGMIFSSLAPTLVGGRVVPGAYFFSLRVHPSARRRGVAARLIRHAWEQAYAGGAELAWAVVVAGNDASVAAFARAGLPRVRDVAVRAVLPHRVVPRVPPAWTVRRAATADLPALAAALNEAHSNHDLWRPIDAVELGRQLGAGGHSLADVRVVTDGTGGILAAGAVFSVGRAASVEMLGHRALPAALNRVLAAVASRLRLGDKRVLVLRHRVLLPGEPKAGRVLLHAVQAGGGSGLTTVAVPLDRRDPAWGVVSRLPGVSGRLHVVARGEQPLGVGRPLYLG